MFKWRVVSRSNVNGKIYTFQKDFDDYDSYREFLDENPTYLSHAHLGDWWSPWAQWDPLLSDYQESPDNGVNRHLPAWVSLDKYMKRLDDKRELEDEKTEKRESLASGKAFLMSYIDKNPDDQEAKDDLAKIDTEIKSLA